MKINEKILALGYKPPKNIGINESCRLYENGKSKSSAILTRYSETKYGLYNFKNDNHILIKLDNSIDIDYNIHKYMKEKEHKDMLRKFEIVKKAETLSRQYLNMENCLQHSYMTKKGLTISPKAKIHKGNMIIPIYNINYANHLIISFQTITANGDKLFTRGQPIKNSYVELFDNIVGDTIIIGEGYATCVSIIENADNDVNVVVAFSASNLKNIVQNYLLKGFNVNVAVDLDAAGRKAAIECHELGAELIFPELSEVEIETGGCDFNDMYQLLNKRGSFYEKVKNVLP